MSDYYLYHIRDPEHSGGFGFDGYIGVTNDPARRFQEHSRSAAAGAHGNAKMQDLYSSTSGRWQMHIVKTGSLENVLASEALLVNRPNLHANIQPGGGPLRGKSTDELIRLSRVSNSTGTAVPRTSVPVPPAHVALIAVAVIAVASGIYILYRRAARKREQKASRGDVPVFVGAGGASAEDDSRKNDAQVLRLHVARQMAQASGIPWTESMVADELFEAVKVHEAKTPWYMKALDATATFLAYIIAPTPRR